MTRRRPHERRGTVVVTTAVCLTMLMAVIALSLDGGVLLDQRRQIQGACDAAALAAADQLFADYESTASGIGMGTETSTTGAAHTSARTTATANGYTDDNGVTTTVTVNIPPTSGAFAGKSCYAEVLISYNQPRYFSQLFGTTTVPIGGRAVALGRAARPGNGIIVLDPNATKSALNAGGGGVITVGGSPIQVNSLSPQAMIANGGGTLVSEQGFNVSGSPGYTTSGAGSSFSGTITPNSPQIADPLRFIPPPDPTTMPLRTGQGKITGSNPVTLQPGVYDGISITSNNANVTFAPGIYYVDGGGINITGGVASGNGVMFYNNPHSNSDQVNISTTVNFTPPTTGPYQGILLFQSRSTTITPAVSIQGSATALLNLTGTFYVPTALLNVTGNGNQNVTAQFISYDLNLSGNGTFYVNWDPGKLPPVRDIRLVE